MKDCLAGDQSTSGKTPTPQDEDTRDESSAGLWERLGRRTPELVGQARQRREEVEPLYQELTRKIAKGVLMSKATVQRELHEIAGTLMAIRRRLFEIGQSLPASAPETATSGDTSEELADLRSRIECVVTDSLTPSIDDLLSAAKD